MDGVKLEFTPESLNAVADRAIELETGARGLRNILEEVMRDVMFNAQTARQREVRRHHGRHGAQLFARHAGRLIMLYPDAIRRGFPL